MKEKETSPPATVAPATPSPKQPSEFMQVINQPHRGTCEYIPYGSQDKIKLTVHIIQNLIAVRTKSGKTCSEPDAIKFLAMCQAKRMNPFEGDCFLIGYDGRDGAPSFALVTAHQTYLKRAELHPEFNGMRSGVIVQEDGVLKDLEGDFYMPGQTVVGGWATVYFKGREQPMHKRLRLSRFQKSFGIWQEDGAGMICKCAEADALRSSFPTMLGGLYLREEINSDPEPSKPEFAAPAKPLFELPKPTMATMPPNNLVPVPVSPTPPPVTQPEPEPPPHYNIIKALRGLCKNAKVAEAEVLDFLVQIGSADTCDTFEQLALQDGTVLQMVHDQFNDIARRIVEVREAGSNTQEGK